MAPKHQWLTTQGLWEPGLRTGIEPPFELSLRVSTPSVPRLVLRGHQGTEEEG